MAFIPYADQEPLSPELAELYERCRDPESGRVANILRIHSHCPAALEAHLGLYKTLMLERSALSRAQREMIAVVVSQVNACHYCLQHHGASLRLIVKDEDFVARLESDYRGVDLSPADRAMLDYAAKLTRTPDRMTRADTDALRQAGFDDPGILDICLVTAYFAFVNRIADGLGVELEGRAG
ncbi:MAG: peroxidase-related enzyme [Planctomycetota bacterium]